MSSSTRRVMVVDDDPQIRLLMARAFTAAAFDVHAFPNGRAALEKLSEVGPECVVSDVVMPDMDGEQLLRAVRARPGFEAVPFVVVSAVRSAARIQALVDAGADAFLSKPFPVGELVRKIRSLTERPETVAVDGVVVPLATMQPPPGSPGPEPAAALGRSHPPQTAFGALAVVAPDPAGVTRFELRPADATAGFGRYTRVGLRRRALVVLTEAVLEPAFVVTTVVTEKGQPLRKIESVLPHPLAREEDDAVVRRQVDLQHDDVLQRLEQLVLDGVRRRVLWSDHGRSVDPVLLAWAISALAQHVERQAGTEETCRILESTHERELLGNAVLRRFRVTPTGRVLADRAEQGRLPRQAVAAVGAWCIAVAVEGLQLDEAAAAEAIRLATQRRAGELERIGFYGRLGRR